ncbi:MAG: exodeoxyribonuclease III [Alphaproteobacteria bacterium]
MKKIASFNVNSINARMPVLQKWLPSFQPDIVLLQEIKTEEDKFPLLDIEALGYKSYAFGQKAYNGVAILSKEPLLEIKQGLSGAEDEEARYIEAKLDSGLTVASVYVPNGNGESEEKFNIKLKSKLEFLSLLKDRAKQLLENNETGFVIGGDFNVIPSDIDVYNPKLFEGDALTNLDVRKKYQEIIYLGLTDAIGETLSLPAYSFWDYQGGAWQKDFGLRIDHLLLSPQAADKLVKTGIDKNPRAMEKPSDHTPVWCELDF